MKILIATGIYPPSIGGPATYSKILMEELPKRGIDVSLLSFDEVRHFPKGLSHILYFAKALKRGRSVNLIYAQDPVSVGLPAMWAAKLLRKRFLLKVVGDYAWEQGMNRFGVRDLLDDFLEKPTPVYTTSVRVLRGVESYVAKQAERIIVPSRYLKKVVATWGIPSERIEVIYNAFEGLPYRPEGEHRKVQLLGRTIVSAGRLVPWKGFLALVEPMVELVKKFPALKLCIIGEGPERNAIERRIRQLELTRNVYLVGKVPRDSLFEYLRQASVFALNTGYEGFSHQLLEVLALGVPLVTTRVGGNPEIIEDGVNGILVPYNDKHSLSIAIERMLRDDDFAASCIQNGREAVKKFTKEKMINELMDLLIT